ncbi:Long chronological lifespan protein 2 [Lodderomyces elongisporus]|nr:Long chronological lifespan protein 2 [Lodderomyces elongisporus]WLF78914.1 Long chronological lifespan protein 2 [Lodderomyces elongisporus]
MVYSNKKLGEWSSGMILRLGILNNSSSKFRRGPGFDSHHPPWRSKTSYKIANTLDTMLQKFLICLSLIFTLASANLFDFLNNQFQGGNGGGGGGRHQNGGSKSPQQHEEAMLNANCNTYLCPDTGICVDAPKFCPCPYPSSQLRCFLPDGRYVCISKPAGYGIADKYNDPQTNFKIDAKDDNIRDCGWVNRAWRNEKLKK